MDLDTYVVKSNVDTVRRGMVQRCLYVDNAFRFLLSNGGKEKSIVSMTGEVCSDIKHLSWTYETLSTQKFRTNLSSSSNKKRSVVNNGG